MRGEHGISRKCILLVQIRVSTFLNTNKKEKKPNNFAGNG